MKNSNSQKGFLLIELMVSMSVFLIVIMIVVGSIVTALDSNNKSQNKKTALDNLNYTLESMSREIRFGTVYRCSISGDLTQPLNCNSPGTGFTFLAANGNRISYTLSGNKITRSVNGGAFQDLTSDSEITIQNLSFRVYGALPYGSDYVQPMVIINVSGYVGSKTNTRGNFDLQTSVSQRKLDI
jgi:prepilin-type N-terminal cleavage/methylation domain-containing protein